MRLPLSFGLLMSGVPFLSFHATRRKADPFAFSVLGPRRDPIAFPGYEKYVLRRFTSRAVVDLILQPDPRRFNSMVNVAYIIAFTVSMLFGALGYVMWVAIFLSGIRRLA
jgi:hypothetical protein